MSCVPDLHEVFLCLEINLVRKVVLGVEEYEAGRGTREKGEEENK